MSFREFLIEKTDDIEKSNQKVNKIRDGLHDFLEVKDN